VARYIENVLAQRDHCRARWRRRLTFLLKAGGGLYWLIPAAVARLLGGVINP